MTSSFAQSQRGLPPDVRDALTNKINYDPSKLRGSGFFLVNQLNVEHLWGNIVPNQPGALSMPSVETLMAHLARNGFNSIRVWSSYGSYLYHHVVANPAQDFPARVKYFLDRADIYDLGVDIVLFNTVGSKSANLLTSCAGGAVEGAVPAPPPHQTLGAHVNICVTTNPCILGCWEYFVSPPYTVAALGIQADEGDLFHALFGRWRSNSQGLHHLQAYLNLLFDNSQSGVALHDALWGMQMYNEPAKLGVDGVPYGDAVKAIVARINVYNADNAKKTVGAETRVNYAQPDDLDGPGSSLLDPWTQDLVAKGLSPWQELDNNISAWNIHTTLDPWGKIDLPAANPFSTYYQTRYMTATGTGGTPGFADMLADLRAHHNAPTGFAFRGAMTDEVACRALTFQQLNDMGIHVINGATQPEARMGLQVWSAFTSDMAGGKSDLGAMSLPGGTVVGPRELETIKDNWKKDITTLTPSLPIATDYSDAIVPAVAASSDGNMVLAVWSDNWDPKPSYHLKTANLPGPDGTERRVFYRVGRRVGVGFQWGQVTTAPPHGLLDDTVSPPGLPGSPGPLIFDSTRRANYFQASPFTPCAADPDWSGAAHPEIERNWSGASPCCAENPYARTLLGRQKLKHVEVVMEPSMVYQKLDTTVTPNRHVFWVAWSRPVPANEAVTGKDTKYYPDDQATNGRYFNVFHYRNASGILDNGTAPNPAAHRAKYEVLLAEVRINVGDENDVIVNKEVLPTTGEFTPGGNRPSDPGASAIWPRLSVSDPDGDLLLTYLKSQDSFFHIAPYATNGSDATWENASHFDVFYWKLMARVRAANGSSWGTGASDAEIGKPYSGGITQWLADTKVQHDAFGACGAAPGDPCTCQKTKKNNPIGPRKLRLAEFFPAVEPSGVIWRNGPTINAKVVFKQLNTWVDPNPTPYGYDAMVTVYDGTSWSAPSRLYCPACIPPAPQNPEPSYEGYYVQGEPLLLHQGNTSLAIFQFRDGIKIMNGVDSEETGSPHLTAGPGMPRFIGGPAGTIVSTNPPGAEVACAAWLKLETDATAPRINLKVWGKYSGRTGTLLDVPYTSQPSLDRDFEARILGVVRVASQQNGAEFMIVHHQNKKLFKTRVLVAANPAGGTTLVQINPAGSELVEVVTLPSLNVLGHKVKGSAIPAAGTNGLVLWSHEGPVRFAQL